MLRRHFLTIMSALSLSALSLPASADGMPRVSMKTSAGEIVLELFRNVARSPDEAELQKQGINVIDQQFAEEAAEADAAAEEFLETQAEATAEQDDAA